MVTKPYFSWSALLCLAAAFLVGVPFGTARAQTVAIGKLFTSAGTCSASVVSGNNIIVTAAHCCWDRSKKAWIGGWQFAPAYNNGNAPYGMFTWADARIPTSWINNGDIPSDVCLIRLNKDSAGHPITYYTGWLGRSWNFPPSQDIHAFGYPGNIGGANILETCHATSSAQPASCGADVLNLACNMTYGSSGGPWIKDYSPGHFGPYNYVNSTVHGYINTTCTGPFGKVFNGPRFTSNNIAMLCNAEGC